MRMMFRIFFVLILITLCFNGKSFAASRSALWKDVDKAENDRLPATAVKLLEQIRQDAVRNSNHSEAAEALVKKIAKECKIEGSKPEEAIYRLQKAIPEASKELKPLLTLILAKWYRMFYSANQYRFSGRTATADLETDDIMSWDLPKLLGHIASLYDGLLTHEKYLRSVPLSEFSNFITEGNQPKELVPNLYEFLIADALSFYEMPTYAVSEGQDAFEIAASSPILDPLNAFLAWTPETTVPDSPLYKSLKLYQKLLKCNIEDGNEKALAENDLKRFAFAQNNASAENLKERSVDWLKQYMESQSDRNYKARGALELSKYYRTEFQDLVSALKYAQMATDNATDFNILSEAANIRSEITAPSFRITTETSVVSGISQMRITHKNINKLYFRVIRRDFMEHVESSYSINSVDDRTVKDLLVRQDYYKSWSLNLKASEDYKEQDLYQELPELRTGFYYLIASLKEDFSERNNIVSAVPVNITNLMISVEFLGNSPKIFVNDAISGKPLKGISINCYEYSRGYGSSSPLGSRVTVLTNSDGYSNLPSNLSDSKRFLLVASSGSDMAYYSDTHYSSNYRGRETSEAHFFTDRSIYRPLQDVFFKAVCSYSDHANRKYEVIPNLPVTVTLRDPNGEVVSSMELRTNSFGSVNGKFTLPAGRITGRYSLCLEGKGDRIRSRKYFSVEEYKRPKFYVELDEPEGSWALGDCLTVKGKAVAYSGSFVSDATVVYRVKRIARMPFWCWWFMPPEIKEIAHGTAKTDKDGNFEVTFTAVPDKLVPEEYDPIFRYVLEADVSDTTGETRSDSICVPVGYKNAEIALSKPSQMEARKDMSFGVNLANLSGKSLAGQIKVKVFSLLKPSKTPRQNPLYTRSRYFALKDQKLPDFSSYNPGEKYADYDYEAATDIRQWKNGDLKQEFNLEVSGQAEFFRLNLPEGAYRIVAESTDSAGKQVLHAEEFELVDSSSDKFTLAKPFVLAHLDLPAQPGDIYRGYWATGYDSGPAYITITHRNKIVKSYWTDSSKNKHFITLPVTEDMRGGFYVSAFQVKENVVYSENLFVPFSWTNKDLSLKFITMNSKLEPAQKYKWIVEVKGENAAAVAAEMVATMYDASLDAFDTSGKYTKIFYFQSDATSLRLGSSCSSNDLRNIVYMRPARKSILSRVFPAFKDDVFGGIVYGFGGRRLRRGMVNAPRMAMSKSMELDSIGDDMVMSEMAAAPMSLRSGAMLDSVSDENVKEAESEEATVPAADLQNIQARGDLKETAFFKPVLLTDREGKITIEFEMPETLTQWNFMGFAHTVDLQSGNLFASAVSQKDIMIEPLTPRFMREGDRLTLTAKITNLTSETQNGSAMLDFFDSETDASINGEFGLKKNVVNFSLEPSSSKTVSWDVNISRLPSIVKYRYVAGTGAKSDGEEGLINILTPRKLVIESLPLYVNSKSTKNFKFDKLAASASSKTLKNLMLTAEMSSNPAWYAVQALPSIDELRYETSDTLFIKYYTNLLAAHIVNSDSRIEQVFNKWKLEAEQGGTALMSALDKNPHLKLNALAETPWVAEAKSEREQKARIADLFDKVKIQERTVSTLDALRKLQDSSGAFPWCPCGRPSFFISAYIFAGFAKLDYLGISVPNDMVVKLASYLDSEMVKSHEDYLKLTKDGTEPTISFMHAFYLYSRSHLLKKAPFGNSDSRNAYNYFFNKAKEEWKKLGSRMSQAHIALAMEISGEQRVAESIAKSLKERSVTNDEMGRFWRDTELSYWWYRAPIETQALMIEVFARVTKDTKAVEECQVWLLKQKQTQMWYSGKATADAVYAFLLQGNDWLVSDNLTVMKLGNMDITPAKHEAESGTGYYMQVFRTSEISPSMAEITVTKPDKGISWGAVHWQYLEDIDKITPHNTGLQLKKTIYVKKDTKKGQVLTPYQGNLSVGDLLTVRVELKADRDMEFVLLKDQRGSGLEPVSVLSRYKYQDGLLYYESAKDTGTDFFIEYLPKGTYVFEYDLRVQLAGSYQSGIAEIQCMYAPEFNAHSGSVLLKVK